METYIGVFLFFSIIFSINIWVRLERLLRKRDKAELELQEVEGLDEKVLIGYVEWLFLSRLLRGVVSLNVLIVAILLWDLVVVIIGVGYLLYLVVDYKSMQKEDVKWMEYEENLYK